MGPRLFSVEYRNSVKLTLKLAHRFNGATLIQRGILCRKRRLRGAGICFNGATLIQRGILYHPWDGGKILGSASMGPRLFSVEYF